MMEEEFKKYLRACYGHRKLSIDQRREVEQAFFSGCLIMSKAMAECAELPDNQAQKAASNLVGEVIAQCHAHATWLTSKLN